ncbi:hypothetical protein AD998_21890 [bacterium 336/3]|nr:hypothetical protein AD998_21890 [bacterium 336/3]
MNFLRLTHAGKPRLIAITEIASMKISEKNESKSEIYLRYLNNWVEFDILYQTLELMMEKFVLNKESLNNDL